MSIATGASPIRPEPGLLGQTVVVIGGSAGIGLETARRARAQGAKLILAARNPDRLEHISRELGALSTAAFDATNFDQLKKFFDGTRHRSTTVLVTGPGPYYAPLVDLDIEKARHDSRRPSVSADAGHSVRRQEGSPRGDVALHGRNGRSPACCG